MTRRQDNATLAVGAGLVAGGGHLRHKGVTPAKIARGSRPWYDPPARALLKHGTTRQRQLYVAGSLAGAAGAAGMGSSMHRKINKRDSFVAEGLKGTKDAVKAKGENLKHKTPLHARAAALGVSLAAGAGGSLAAHRTIDRVARHTKLRAPLTALAGTAAAAASLPVANKAVQATTPGYEVTPAGVKRARKAPVRASSKAGRTIDARHRSMQTRHEIVPSDHRFSKDLSRGQKRAIITAAGSVPVVGDFAGARAAGRLVPKEQRRKAEATQLAGSLGGSAAGGVGGAYAGAALSRHKGVARHAEALDHRISAAQARIPGAAAFGAASAKAKHAFKPAGASSGRAGAAVRAATKPLKGKARAAASVGSLVGSAVAGQAGGFKATTINLDRAEHVKKAAAPMTPTQERKQLRRRSRNAAITTINSGLGAAGVGVLVASRGKAVKPATRAHLERAALGTAVAGGGLGAVSGFQGASIARRDIKARQKQLVGKALPDQANLHVPGALPRRKTYRASNIATTRRANGVLVAVRRAGGIA